MAIRKKIFITQQIIDQWIVDGKASIADNFITVHLKGGDSHYKLKTAINVIAIESKEEDPSNLVGKVVASELLQEKGIEVYMNSAIYKDEAYKIEEGFLGILQNEATGEKQDNNEEEQKTTTANNKKSDEDLLAEYLLKNM